MTPYITCYVGLVVICSIIVSGTIFYVAINEYRDPRASEKRSSIKKNPPPIPFGEESEMKNYSFRWGEWYECDACGLMVPWRIPYKEHREKTCPGLNFMEILK